MNKSASSVPIYIRVSSEDQVQGTSLVTQLRDCKAAAEREGFAPGEVFADEGESAKTIEGRPAFMNLLDHIKKQQSPAVIVWKIDRLARNNLDAQIVRSKLHAFDCRLISATEPISDDPSGKFMFDVLSAVAEYDNRLRAERSRIGMTAQAQDGWWVHTAPCGYMTARAENNKPTLVPDPIKGPLVAEAFRLAARGVPQKEILEEVTMKGLTTRSGKPLSKQSLSMLLANPVYAGLNRSRLAGEKRTRGRWEALVAEEVWMQAQTRLRAGRMPRLAQDEFPLKPVLVCGECGKKITGSYSQGRSAKYAYYHCPACGLRARTKDVDDALAAKIAELSMDADALEHLETLIKGMMADEFGPRAKAKEKARKRLVMLEEQLDRLIHLHLTDGIDRNRYDSKRSDLEWRIMAARLEYSEADGEKIDLVEDFHRAREFLMRPGVFWNTASPSERTDAFPLFFDGPLQLHTNKKVRTVRLDGSNCPIWLPRLDSNQRHTD